MIKDRSKAIALPVAVGAGALLAVVLPDSWPWHYQALVILGAALAIYGIVKVSGMGRS
jgi:hypothetical protein